MAKTTKKAFVGITSKAPTVKKTATSKPKNSGPNLVSFGSSKTAKPKSTGPSNASKLKKFFADKPKYTSEQIVENKKLQAQIDAAAKKKKKK
jgi:hypothetical protein